MNVLATHVIMEVLALTWWDNLNVPVLLEPRELCVRKILMIVTLEHVSTEVSVLTRSEASLASVEQDTLGPGARETSTSVCPTPAPITALRTVFSSSTIINATANKDGEVVTVTSRRTSAPPTPVLTEVNVMLKAMVLASTVSVVEATPDLGVTTERTMFAW